MVQRWLRSMTLAWEPLAYEYEAFDAGNDFRAILSPALPTGRMAPATCFMDGRAFVCLLDSASADAVGPGGLHALAAGQLRPVPRGAVPLPDA